MGDCSCLLVEAAAEFIMASNEGSLGGIGIDVDGVDGLALLLLGPCAKLTFFEGEGGAGGGGTGGAGGAAGRGAEAGAGGATGGVGAAAYDGVAAGIATPSPMNICERARARKKPNDQANEAARRDESTNRGKARAAWCQKEERRRGALLGGVWVREVR